MAAKSHENHNTAGADLDLKETKNKRLREYEINLSETSPIPSRVIAATT